MTVGFLTGCVKGEVPADREGFTAGRQDDRGSGLTPS
jgi:hypothetical protein